MYLDDFAHLLFIGKFNIMENAAAQECVRQFLFRVGGYDDDGTLFCLYGFLRFGDIKFHFVQLPKQVVGEFQIRFVDFVNQQNHLFIAGKCFTQLAQLYIFRNVVYAFIAELAVIQALYNVINIKPVLRFCGGFNVPDNELFAQSLRDGLRKHGFACARLALYQQRFLQGNCDIDRTHQLVAGYIVFTALECHIHLYFRLSFGFPVMQTDYPYSTGWKSGLSIKKCAA